MGSYEKRRMKLQEERKLEYNQMLQNVSSHIRSIQSYCLIYIIFSLFSGDFFNLKSYQTRKTELLERY